MGSRLRRGVEGGGGRVRHPRTACFYARRALELAVSWANKHDPALRLPYQVNLSALINKPSLKQAVGDAVYGRYW